MATERYIPVYVDDRPLSSALELYVRTMVACPYVLDERGDIHMEQMPRGHCEAHLAVENLLDAAIVQIVAQAKVDALVDAGIIPEDKYATRVPMGLENTEDTES